MGELNQTTTADNETLHTVLDYSHLRDNRKDAAVLNRQPINNKAMKNHVKKAIEDYQCVGCVSGSDTSCFLRNPDGGEGCGRHLAGTFVSGIGKIMLGMPKGFCRVGHQNDLRPNIYPTFQDSDWKYGKWNVPTWKYLSPEGHTFVRGFRPRTNSPFLHIFLENCIDKVSCLEITQEDIDYMD